MTQPVIQVRNLGKSYQIRTTAKKRYHSLRDDLMDGLKNLAKGEWRSLQTETFWALKDINFDINQGDIVGIIGRNGAGKSTLLKILSQIVQPTTGEITIRGKVGSLLEVGTGFHPELTGRENIFMNGAVLGMKRSEISRKFDEIVTFAEVEKFLDTPVKFYSSGMYVRLAFAVAAHLEPEVLIIDEVLAVGDAAFQKKCLGKMEDVSKSEGKTVLFVSHQMAAIQVLCTQVIRLFKGEVIGKGDVNEQINLYLNSCYDRQYINSDKFMRLSDNLNLTSFKFSPNSAVTGESMEFSLSLTSNSNISVEAITILIHSYLGICLAVIDLRNSEGSYKLNVSQLLTVKGSIKSLPLIEGEYHIGLYIKSEGLEKTFLDILRINIIDKVLLGSIVPYPSRTRGLIELDVLFSVN